MNFQNTSSLFYHDRVAHARTMCGVVYSHAHHRVGTAPLACQRGLMVIVPRPRYACTPTEVHTNPDRGTHVSRPRYAHFTTEIAYITTKMSICGDRNAATRQPQQPILEARVGEHISWSHLAIVGAIVYGVSVSANLMWARKILQSVNTRK